LYTAFFEPVPGSVGEVGGFVGDCLAGRDVVDTDVAALLVSELATHAIMLQGLVPHQATFCAQ
jgi:hypothetical protein